MLINLDFKKKKKKKCYKTSNIMEILPNYIMFFKHKKSCVDIELKLKL